MMFSGHSPVRSLLLFMDVSLFSFSFYASMILELLFVRDVKKQPSYGKHNALYCNYSFGMQIVHYRMWCSLCAQNHHFQISRGQRGRQRKEAEIVF